MLSLVSKCRTVCMFHLEGWIACYSGTWWPATQFYRSEHGLLWNKKKIEYEESNLHTKLKWKSLQICVQHLIKQCRKPTTRNISHVNLILFNQSFFLILQKGVFKTMKLGSRPLSSGARCDSSFQTEHAHGPAFSDQTMHVRILVPILKCFVLISSIIPRSLLPELHCILYVHTYIYAHNTVWSKHLNGSDLHCDFMLRLSKVLTLAEPDIVNLFFCCGRAWPV